MIPFTPIAYYDQINQQSWTEFRPGFIPLYVEDIKYDSDDGPLKLVHSSPSFSNEENGQIGIILVYEINPNYGGQGWTYLYPETVDLGRVKVTPIDDTWKLEWENTSGRI